MPLDPNPELSAVLYDAFNGPPKHDTHHHYDADADEKIHTFHGKMLWRTPAGFSGKVPIMPSTGISPTLFSPDAAPVVTYASTRENYGVPPSQVRFVETSTFEIAYTVSMPAGRVGKNNNDLPLIGLLHGVPGNRKWKFNVQRLLAQYAIVVSFDMLGKGESSMVLDYRFEGQHEENEAWDWVHHVPYVHALFMDHIPHLPQVNRSDKLGFIFQADDWAVGIAIHYAVLHSITLQHLILVNGVFGDGYFVIEIGTIGRMAAVRRKDENAFMAGAFGLPQTLIGVEKYMVEDRKRFNRYTESSFMFPYQDTDYQSGKAASDMHPHYWNIAVLADMSSRLAPRQLQPFHPTKNPAGVRVDLITVPVAMIWGMEDQMMPPVQMMRAHYFFPNAPVSVHEIAGANHFAEIDKPEAVVRAMLNALLQHNKTATRAFLGVGDDLVYKGDETQLMKRLERIYGLPNMHG